MDVVLGLDGSSKLTTYGRLLDVEAARRHVRRDEAGHLARLEVLEGADPLRWLRSQWIAVALTPRRSRSEASRLAATFVRVKTRSCSEVLARWTRWLEEVDLPVAVDRVTDLRDDLRRGVRAGRDLDGRGVAEELLEPGDGSRRRTSRGRAGLALSTAGARRSANVGDEAHVEHPVGLVQDEDLDLAEVAVRWPTWSSSRPGVATRISTPAGAPDLRVDRDAAEDDRRAEGRGARDAGHLGDLHRQLARRGEDEGPDGWRAGEKLVFA